MAFILPLVQMEFRSLSKELIHLYNDGWVVLACFDGNDDVPLFRYFVQEEFRGAGIAITYKDGTSFDMTRTRVKETEPNPYVEGGIRPVKFEKAIDNSGKKRAPTQQELEWFNNIKWD